MWKKKKLQIQIVLITLAFIFLVIGIRNQEYQQVMTKAINICLECIGIG